MIVYNNICLNMNTNIKIITLVRIINQYNNISVYSNTHIIIHISLV